MTCEVAVMNTRGIALAADSAVALDDGDKVYNGAEKLFQLAPSAPVGIMTYGAAGLMGVPWETVIAGYARRLGDRRFETLDEYFGDLVEFIEGARPMFPESVQRDRLRRHATGIWKRLYADELDTRMKKRHGKNGRDRNALLLQLIRDDHEKWRQYPPLNGLGDEFADRALAEHGTMLDQVERDVFGTTEHPDEIREGLRTTLRYFLTRGAFTGDDDTGLVIAGMGEAEPFPSLLHCRVGTITLDRLKIMKVDHTSITHECTASVTPFAQRYLIDMIVGGIHPNLAGELPGMMERSLHAGRKKKRSALADAEANGPTDRFRDLLEAEIREKYSDPFITAVAALPRHDLAVLAESLVNLTAIRTRISANQKETVRGPIDVAVLSKGAGFVWVRRKSLAA
jgi:hypothetical protein